MKWFATILCLYLSVLLVYPCSDSTMDCTKIVQDSTETAHHHNGKTNDSCTPFCFCSCCSIQISAYHFNYSTLGIPTKKYYSPLNVIEEIKFISNYYGNIWQPPKIIA
ncbi:MAG: hypothetical protein E6Q95_04325 [Chitinophagaceae bacterium]|nr:MAG: hypothetical protein E6Q95_04325 [Chitinophagaceae bacterium]